MIWRPNILARGDDIGELAIFIIFAVMAAVSGLIKWLNKKAAERQAETQQNRLNEQLEQYRREEAGQKPRTAFQQQVDGEQTARAEQHRPSLYSQPGRPQPPLQPVPHMPQVPQVPQHPRRQATIQQLRARQATTEVVLEPVQAEHSLVHAEVTMPSTKHQDPYAFRHDPGRPSIVGIPGTSMGVDLSDPDTLRQAIVFHELLGPPKAMRTTPEPWEL